MEGIFDAIHFQEVQEQAEQFIKLLAQTVFDAEIRRDQAREPGMRPSPSALLSSFLDAIPHALAREQPGQAEKARTLISSLVADLVAMSKPQSVTPADIMPILHQMANRFITLCLEEAWVRKSAGCSGMRIMTLTPDLGVKWVTDREIDLVRTLLHVLKDLPVHLPRGVDDVVDVLTDVLRIGNSKLDFISDSAVQARNKLLILVSLFFPELQSSNPVARQAGQTGIELLATLSGKPIVDLLMPHRDRMLANIYTKPLRALPYSIQIGVIEAVRYCVSLSPPLIDLNDELLRLLHETLALADAEDAALTPPVRNNLPIPRQTFIEITKVRVACIKLLTASMPLTDFFSRQHQTRQRYLCLQNNLCLFSNSIVQSNRGLFQITLFAFH